MSMMILTSYIIINFPYHAHGKGGGGSDIYNVHLSISTTQAYKINSQPMMFEFFNKMKSFTENAKTPDLMGEKKINIEKTTQLQILILKFSPHIQPDF